MVSWFDACAEPWLVLVAGFGAICRLWLVVVLLACGGGLTFLARVCAFGLFCSSFCLCKPQVRGDRDIANESRKAGAAAHSNDAAEATNKATDDNPC